MADSIEHADGTVLIVEFGSLPDDKQFGFDPRGSISIGHGREIHPRFYSMSVGDAYQGRIMQKVLIDRIHWSMTTLLARGTDLPIKADGKPLIATPGQKLSVTNLSVNSGPIQITMAAADILLTPGKMQITARKK